MMGRRIAWRVAVGVVLAGCAAASSSEPWSSVVDFEVDLEAAQRWTATGDLVDRGEICPRGTRQVLRATDAATDEPLRIRDEVRILGETIEGRITPPVTWRMENSCADGSGSFVSLENWETGTWTVSSGTGAYRQLRGDGQLGFTTSDYTKVAPRQLIVEARLEGSSPP